MLDIKKIRSNPEEIKSALSRRDPELAKFIDEIVKLDEEHREALQEKENLQAKRNELSKIVGQKKSSGEDADTEITELNKIKEDLKAIADKEPELFAKQTKILEGIPNTPDPETPDGLSEDDNQEILKHGEPRQFDFEPKWHDEIGEQLDILDFERGVKIAGSKFTLLKGMGAKLERALIAFFLDKAEAKGYTEVMPPLMVNQSSLYGTGQLPKFEEDLYKIANADDEGKQYYLLPTAEVPVTNIHADEILNGDDLPLNFCAYTPCFRSEAGAAGKDTRGIIRQHQFNKVELVKMCKAEDGTKEHEKLTQDAEELLQELGLPYRKMLLCAGDMGANAQKCYDLEVWFPSQNKYREISSCSHFGDFQARRAKIRYKDSSGGKKAKAELVHTINGSALAVGRCLAAILENYQNADGSVDIPEALQPYLKGLKKIEPAKEKISV